MSTFIRGKDMSTAKIGFGVLLPGAALYLFYRIIKNEWKMQKAIQQFREDLTTIEEERKLSEEKLRVEFNGAVIEFTGKSNKLMKELNAKTSSLQSFVETSRKELSDSFAGTKTGRKTGEELELQLKKFFVEFNAAVTEVTEKTEWLITEVNTKSAKLEKLVEETRKELSDSFVEATTEINTTVKEISFTVDENSQNCLDLKENDLMITKQFDAMKLFVSKVLAGQMTSESVGSEPSGGVSIMSGTNLETSSPLMTNSRSSRRVKRVGMFSRT